MLFNGDPYIIVRLVQNHDYFRIRSVVFPCANWTSSLTGETRLALWTTDQEPRLTGDVAQTLRRRSRRRSPGGAPFYGSPSRERSYRHRAGRFVPMNHCHVSDFTMPCR